MEIAAGLSVFILATYGIGTVVGVLKAGQFLLQRPLDRLSRLRWLVFLKPLAALVRCPPCIALWAGLALSIKGLSPCLLVWPNVIPGIAWGVDAFVAAGATWLLHVSAERISQGLDV